MQTGYKLAVRRGYKYVIQMDADGQHDVCNIKNIRRALLTPDENGNRPDIVLGSRFMDGGSSFKLGTAKKIAISAFRRIIKFTTGLRITDPTTGLQGLSRNAFLYCSKYSNLNLKYTDANMIIQMHRLGFAIKEIPAIMHERKFGKSMHTGIKPLVYTFWMMVSIIVVLFRTRKIEKNTDDHNEKK